MSRYKPKAKKIRLGKEARHTKWAPVWVIPKMFKGLKRVHPSSITHVKRSWRRTKTRA